VADRRSAAGLFVGRTDQLASISSCVEDVLAGRPWVVWLEGDAGSGKSALLRQAESQLPVDMQVVRGQADELASDVPFELSSQLGSPRSGAPFAVGMDLLGAWAERQDHGPVVVVVEDLHWADSSSRQALLAACNRLDEDRVLVLVTCRPGVDGGWERFRFDESRCCRLGLEPLSATEIGTLATSGGITLTLGQAERLREHTRGHPLYVRMLLAELTPAQLQAPEGVLPAPRSLASTTVATLWEQPDPARELAFALAVVNQSLPLSMAGRIAGIDQETEAFESLLAVNLVRWHEDGLGTSIEFAHPLFRAAIYEDLSPTRRRDLHRAAAETLSGDAALAHRVWATTGPDPELFDELTDVAGAELERGATGLAARTLLWASSVGPDSEATEQSLLRAARLLLRDNQVARVAALRPRIEACRDSDHRNMVLGLLDWHLGQASDAEQRWQGITSPTRATAAEPALVADALTQLGGLYAIQSRAQEAVDVSTRALELPLDDVRERLAWNALTLGEGMLHGAPAGLERLAERLPQAAELVPGSDVDLLVTRGNLGFYAGRNAAAADDMRAAISLARKGHVPLQLARSHLQLSLLLVILGAWDEALLNARTALSLVTEDREVWMQAQVFAALATVHGYRGQWELADEQVERAAEAAGRQETSEAVFTARIARAAVARARNEPDGVVDALGDLAAVPPLIPMFSSLGWWPTLIAALIDRGDIDEAEAHIQELQQGADVRRLDFSGRIAGLTARVLAARQRPEEATKAFGEGLDPARTDLPFLDRAQLHQGFGRHLRAVGDRKGAVGQLRTAHQLLTAAGGAPFVGRVEEDLVASGLRPEAKSDRSAFDLTEREQDVVALVAKGLTNRETAAQLYISDKAVEYHLRNVFGKLGISSRRELRQRVSD
jgi:DNA-binding CsgD family transcriptional regulator